MRSLHEVATDLHWCAPWALDLFQKLLGEYRDLLAEQPEERHLAQLRVWEGSAPGRRRPCHPPVALARPGLEAIVRQEVTRRGQRLARRLEQAEHSEVAHQVRALLKQFEQHQPQRRGLDGLPQLLRDLRRQGAVLACHLRSWPLELPVLLSEIAYEIVAEGLRNALRHGDGRRATLRLELRDGWLGLDIRNPVRDPLVKVGNGLGLRHLRWRVRSCQGRYRFLEREGQARLQVRLPLPENAVD